MNSSASNTIRIGRTVPGYVVPVINERAVRAAAGILFLIGGISFAATIFQSSLVPLQRFGVLFMIDMLIRITGGDRWSPTLTLGRIITRKQSPQWVGAQQKEFAWWLGFGIAVTSCSVMGFSTGPLWVQLALCSVCLTLLFLETAFGICVGCMLQHVFGATTPRYCPGSTCEVDSNHEMSIAENIVPTPPNH